jgi:hypothetical protein
MNWAFRTIEIPPRLGGCQAVPHDAIIEPGQFVRHPQQPDWGMGQVQSVIDGRITVNFEHAGKVLVNARVISLDVLHDRSRRGS